jgi:hypothetical protein
MVERRLFSSPICHRSSRRSLDAGARVSSVGFSLAAVNTAVVSSRTCLFGRKLSHAIIRAEKGTDISDARWRCLCSGGFINRFEACGGSATEIRAVRAIACRAAAPCVTGIEGSKLRLARIRWIYIAVAALSLIGARH